jgi:hypothetical protein
LRIAVAWAQYVAGISTPLFEDIRTPLPHLEAKWISSVRAYLQYVGATIELDEPYTTVREREHDWHIMDAIIQSGQFSLTEIRQLNYCRLYLQSTTISDITNANGDVMDKYMYQGEINHSSSSINKWHRVNQERPADKHWLLWQKATKLWSTDDGRLHQPLGKWLIVPSQQRRCWPAYGTPQGQIFLRITNGIVRFKRYRITREDRDHEGWYQVHQYVATTKTVPEGAFPISLEHLKNGVRMVQMGNRHRQTWQSKYLVPKTPTLANQDFATFIGAMDAWEFELLQHVQLESDAFTICRQLKDGFVAACDGSVEYETNGSFGWIIALRSGKRMVRAYGPARGSKPSSYRAEGYGVLSFHRFLVRIQEYCSIMIGEDWTVTSDNIALRQRAEWSRRRGEFA